MSLSNNTTLRTNFNESPYWDDFDETKGFHRALFNPERGVQARELTTIQTMVQNQLSRFANHIFKDGSRVAGGDFRIDLDARYVKLRDLNPLGNTVTVSNFIGTELVSDTTGVKAHVMAANTGSEAATPNLKTVYVRYTGANTSGTAVFVPGENLTANSGFTAKVASGGTAVGNSALFTLTEGIVYAKGFFVWHPEATIVLEKYHNRPDCRVGLTVTEDIVTFNDDATLLDPAQEASAYQSPGSDRLKLATSLSKIGLEDTVPDDFVELCVIKGGVLQSKTERSQYSDIRDEMARRTYVESGDYVVRGMNVRAREHLDTGTNNGLLALADGGNTSLLALGIEPGVAYVRGYDYEMLVTRWLTTPKGIDYKEVADSSVAAGYGGYVLVDEMVGFMDVHSGATVSLYDTADNRITDKDGSTISPAGSVIGTARVRAIAHETGVPGTAACQYRLYLYDIVMTGGDFRSVRAVYVNHASVADGGADIVLDANNECFLYEATFRSLIYQLPVSNLRRVRDDANQIDMTFQFQRAFDVTIVAGGTFSISTVSDETLPFSAGALNDTQKNDNFVVVLNSAVDSANLTGTVTAINGQNTVAGVGTAFTTQLYTGQLIKIGSAIRRITTIASANSLQVDSNWSANTVAGGLKRTYLAGDVLDFTRRGGSGNARTITVNSQTSVSFDLKETLGSSVTAKAVLNLKKVDAREKRKVIRRNRLVQIAVNSNPGGTTGPWCLGIPDVYQVTSVRRKSGAFASTSDGTAITSLCSLDNGQRDDIYDMAHLYCSEAATAGDYLLVTLDHFEHDASQGDGYLSVNSYPIDDTNTANTLAIMTKDIPIFRSPTQGGTYALRDCIDARPIRTATATSTTSIGSVTTNPSANSAPVVGLSGLMPNVPNEDFTFSMSYYLPRRDIVVVDTKGQFRIIEGVSALNPYTPPTPDDSMLLATVEVTPYPSIAPPGNGAYRSQLVKVSQRSNRRYTMRDIGVLDQRIKRLEYYMSLSLLEKQTADMKILDENGLDRFKNGFIVDPFTGTGVADVGSPDFRAAIDPLAKEMRPSFTLNNTQLEYANTTSNIYRNAKDATIVLNAAASGFANGEVVYQGTMPSPTAQGTLRWAVDDRLYVEGVTGTFAEGVATKGQTSSASVVSNTVTLPTAGSLAVLPYTHLPYISQRFATTTRNTAGYMYNWLGEMTLTPDGDHWTDTTALPDLRLNFEGNLDAWNTIQTAWTTEWGSWEQRWTGTETTTQVAPSSVSQVIYDWNELGILVESEGTNIDPRVRPYIEANYDGATFAQKFEAAKVALGGYADLRNRTMWSFGSSGTRTTTVRTGEEVRTGTRRSIVPTTIEENVGSSIVDVSLLPFMRSRVLLVRVEALKPSTRVYAFFDGEAVGDYCRPVDTQAWDLLTSWRGSATDTTDTPVLDITNLPMTVSGFDASWLGAEGDVLQTDGSGRLLLFFRLPASAELRFPVGQKYFRVCDNPQNSTVYGQITTSADALYTASGIHQVERNTVVTTRSLQVREEVVTETKALRETNTNTTSTSNANVSVTPYEPVAQSFAIKIDAATISGGFLTKVDLYFATKHASLPITVELREMQNSVITPRVIPFARVTLQPADVHVSDDGSKPTPFVFPSPIYLQRDVEYAMIIRPGAANPDYRIWVAQIGQQDVRTGERVAVAPYVGVLYASSNDLVYSPVQNEDVKFTAYIAQFDTAATGTLRVHNTRKEFLRLIDETAAMRETGTQVWGEPTITLTTQTGTANTGQVIWGVTSNAYGTIASANNSAYEFRLTSISATPFADGENVVFKFANTVTTGATGTAITAAYPVGHVEFYGSTNSNTQMHLSTLSSTPFTVGMEVYAPSANARATIEADEGLQMNLLYTQIRQVIYALTNIDWSAKTTTADTHDLSSSWQDIIENTNAEFETERVVLGGVSEDDDLAGERSLQLRALLTTETPYLSPVVDLDYLGGIVVGNRINNDATGEANTAGGNALARYICRVVPLVEDNDAEDVQVYITAYNPSTTTIKVYAKYRHAEDSDLMRDRPWVEMEQLAPNGIVYSSTESKGNFIEQEYKLPDAVLTGTNGAVQYTNSENVTLTGYRYLAVKVVLLSPNTSLVPRLRDFRAIALQR